MSDKYWFDEKAADKVVRFIEKLCTHVKGEKAIKAEPLILEGWQKKIIRDLFGWKREDGSRRYRKLWLELPRKNGKTSLTAAIGLYMLLGDNEAGGEIYFAAASQEQARIGYDISRQMVRQNQALSDRCEIYQYSLVQKRKDGIAPNTFKALSAEAYSKHGLNASCVLLDEVHAQPNRDLYDTLTTSMGARKQPLLVCITTAGIKKKGNIGWELHRYAKDVAKGKIKDDEMLSIIYAAGENDDPFSEETWKKCNPNYDISVNKNYLEEQAKLAKSQSTFYNTFLRLHLNVWTSSDKVFISDKDFAACNLNPLPDEFFYGKRCICTFDLSATTDFTALCIGTKDEDGVSHMKVWTFIPEDKAVTKNIADQLYAWQRDGWVDIVPGRSLNYGYVYEKIKQMAAHCEIIEVAYDRWNKNELVNRLDADGVNLKDFGQGFVSMSPATKEFEKRVMEKKINYGGNPVMEWMISNVAITEDPAGNIKPNKQKSTDKIDGVIAMIMCDARLNDKHESGDSKYEYEDLIVI